ncbi:MAG: lipid A biosynthesis acyltransferase [Rhodoferax sp.]|uniref:LpxL/LpxP family acyltransferase n=1 Tax=Rhodoferax sp. TaxID=50421 RepID=UPI00178F0E03|nr:lipid A biosynthesis acyltransferase [Rhodoferax sp.]NMM12310.1 lipid A biosynthesis acyltransferase [Rhodoferax sp.]NMM20269.1 lipid A biosynthesis acyltransferase [Rhodoferax sp.]
MFSHFGITVMHLLGRLPLAWVRALGWLLGCVLYALAVPRRRVAQTNLRLCFPDKSEHEIKHLTFQTFVHFAQAWLDRGWLWHGSPEVTRQRLTLSGAVRELQGAEPVVIFAPHFVGLDAGWTALTQQLPRQFTTIYTDQANKVLDAWILTGRQRFGQARLFGRVEGVKTIVATLRAGAPLYLLPDMNFGLEDSVFVPFYGVPAATVPSLSRFAKLGRAKVVPVVTRMTRQGYEVQVMPSWPDFPSDDVAADTALMNLRLQSFIDTMPDQYFWVHKRFKDRPPGAPAVY